MLQSCLQVVRLMKKLKKNLPEGVKYEFARYKGVKVKLVPNKKKSNKTK